jgi:hypothetical protein
MSEGSGPAADSEPRVHYRIQVRAQESMEGATRIVEYLRDFGFQEHYFESDPKGRRGPEGQRLYTVFVGKYFDRAEADRECDRMKQRTRTRPYKRREDYFSEALVITRTRN